QALIAADTAKRQKRLVRLDRGGNRQSLVELPAASSPTDEPALDDQLKGTFELHPTPPPPQPFPQRPRVDGAVEIKRRIAVDLVEHIADGAGADELIGHHHPIEAVMTRHLQLLYRSDGDGIG